MVYVLLYGEIKMTKLKKIYYPILAAVFAIALILGFVSSGVNFGAKSDQAFVDNVRVHAKVMESVHNSYESSNQEAVRNYIVDSLVDGGVYNSKGLKSDGYAQAVIDGPSYVVQDVTLNEETLDAISGDGEKVIAIRNLVNVVVAIPGKSEQAVLFTANYDSAAKSQSGTESIQAAVMLQTIRELAADYENNVPEKTLLFVFTDAEHEGALGGHAFVNQFEGFDGIVDKIVLSVNFGANGTGALAVSSDKISVSEVKANASALNDAIDGMSMGVSDYDVFDGAKINVFFSGNASQINTPADTIANVSDSKIKAIGGAMDALINAYGFGSDEIGESKVIGSFSFVGFNVSHSAIVSYVLGAVAVLLLVGAVFAILRSGKKLGGLVKGVVAQLATIILSVVILFACYFVLALMLAGFGVVPIHAITTVKYMNVGLFVSGLILAFAAYVGSFLVVRKLYSVKATEAARGGAIWIMILGIVMAFVMPAAAMQFAIVAVLEGVALIAAALLSKKFKERNNADIERLFVYTLPLIVFTPAMIPVLMNASYSLSAVYLPLILAVAMFGFSVIAPYFGMLKPAMAKLFAKLPKHTIRVEKVVTEQVEGAKKGRFQEVTSKKVVNEKVEWQYRNRIGVAILAVLSSVLIILFAVCPKHNFSTNIVDTYSYREALKDDAVVYCWQQVGSTAVTEKLRVYDQVAYKYFGMVDNEFAWNEQLGAFEKDFLGDSVSLHGTNVPLSITVVGSNSLEFTTFDSGADSFIDIKFTNVKNVTKITVKIANDELEFANDGNDTVRIELPYDDNDYGNFTVEFEYETAFSIGVDYTQYVMGERTEQRMKTILEYVDILSALDDVFADNQGYTGGMIFNRQNTYTMS